MGWALLSIRHLRANKVPGAALAALVLATALVAGLGPRLLDLVADRAIRSEVASARVIVRNLQLLEERRIAADADTPLRHVDTAGDDLAARMPESTRSLTGSRTAIVDTPRWSIVSETIEPSTAVLRVQQAAVERVRFTGGRPPAGAVRRETTGTGDEPETWSVLEGALSGRSAAGFGVEPGDLMLLSIDGTDPLAAGHGDRLAIDVVGVYELADPADPYWFDDPSLTRPIRRGVTQDEVYLHAPILLAEAAYSSLMEATGASELPMRYTWRYFVDPGRLDAERLDAVADDLRRMESTFSSTLGAGGTLVGTRLRSGLPELVDDFRGRWHAAEAILLVIAIGPGSVALAALGLLAMLAASRRRPALSIWTERGASRLQVLGAVAVEALLLVVPAVAIAAVIAWAIVPSAPAGPALGAAGAVGTAAFVLVCLLGRPPGAPSRAAVRAPRRSNPRRIALEVLVVGLAVVGAVLLRQRGVVGTDPGAAAGADPFIAAVPALIGLAAGLVAMRLFAVPVGLLGRVAAWRRDLVPVLALRRAVQAGTAPRILLVLMATASIGIFSSAALVHLDVAAEAAGWQQVGAPFLLTDLDRTLPSRLDPASLPGVEAAAVAHRVATGRTARGLRVEVLAIDAAEYRAVVAGTPGDPGIPRELMAAAPTGPPLPAIVARSLSTGREPVTIGSMIELLVDGRTTTVQAVAVRDAFPTLPEDIPFVVVSRDHLRDAVRGARFATTHVFLRAPDEGAAALRTALAEDWPGVVVEGRAQRTAELRRSPVTDAVRSGAAIAVAVAVVYAALAVAAALALAGAARAVEVAQLRTIGLTARQAGALVVVEHGPAVALAFAAGVVLGLGLFAVLRPGLGLGGLVGTSLEVPLSVDPSTIGLVLVTVSAIGAVGIAIGAILQARADPALAARQGLE